MKKSWFQLCILERKQQKVRENPFFTRLWNYRIFIWVWVVIWLPGTWNFFISLSSRLETALSPAKCHLSSRNSWMARVCLFCHRSGFICEWSFKAKHSQGWRHSASIPRHLNTSMSIPIIQISVPSIHSRSLASKTKGKRFSNQTSN